MSDMAQANLPGGTDADIHLSRLLAESFEEPWYKSLAQSVKELIHPPQLPPLEVTSKPVAVKDIWGLYGRKRESGLLSLAIHTGVVVLLFTVASSKAVQVSVKQAVHLIAPDIAPYVPEAPPKPKTMGGGGG